MNWINSVTPTSFTDVQSHANFDLIVPKPFSRFSILMVGILFLVISR